MSTTPNPTIHTAVRILNEAFAADPAAIHSLICNCVPCNQALADHPTVIAQSAVTCGKPNQALVGMLGVLNGVLEAMTGDCVASEWSEPGPDKRCTLLGFQVYKRECEEKK